MNQIANTLEVLGPGLTVLAPLMDDPDPRVQASAGAYLLGSDLMPDRVVPVLRRIDKEGGSSSASFTAMWALSDWDLRQKARGN